MVCIVSESRSGADFTDSADFKSSPVKGVANRGRNAIRIEQDLRNFGDMVLL